MKGWSYYLNNKSTALGSFNSLILGLSSGEINKGNLLHRAVTHGCNSPKRRECLEVGRVVLQNRERAGQVQASGNMPEI